jgi:hypothetical protein
MKSVTLLTTLMLGLCASAHAAVYQSPFFNPDGFTEHDGVIPVDTPTGWSDTRTVSGFTGPIGSLQVTLNITGGFNSDLYADLSYDPTPLDPSDAVWVVVLLNHVGDGNYGDTGFAVTLKDSAANSIHYYQAYLDPTHVIDVPTGAITGDWKPDGGGFSTLSALDGNGEWTLFFAETNGTTNDPVNTVVSWSLSVPEPINVALGVFGVLFLIVGVCRSERVKKLFGKPTEAIV